MIDLLTVKTPWVVFSLRVDLIIDFFYEESLFLGESNLVVFYF